MRIILFLSFLLISSQTISQSNDLPRLLSALLSETPIEEDLQELCDQIGGRVTGSSANEAAVEWALKKFEEAGISAHKHAFEMPALWLEESTTCSVNGTTNFQPLVVSKYHCPPGQYHGELISVGTGTAADFEKAGGSVKGNFVLIQTELCMDINGLFAEYGASSIAEDLARQNGAAGIVFMASRPNKLLYRFVTKKGFDNQLPQIVMAREDAKRCIRELEQGNKLDIQVDIKAHIDDAYQAHNVIGEIVGSEYPDEIVVIGAHIDSWALGTGANDNGCNVSLMIDIARQMKQLDIQPKRTIRFALWNGEEQGFFGSEAYVRDHKAEMDQHVMAMSVDIGSGPIIGFFMNGRKELEHMLDRMLKPVSAFGPYLQIPNAVVGTDNFDFMLEGVTNLIANHKPTNYGLNYHAASDTYDKVDLKSIKINSAIVAAVTWGFANGDASDVKLPRHHRAEIEQIMAENNLEFSMRIFNVWEPWANRTRGQQK